MAYPGMTTLGTPGIARRATLANTGSGTGVKRVVGLNNETSTGPNAVSMRIWRLTGLRTDSLVYSTSWIPADA